MNLTYIRDPELTAEQVADLFRRSTIRRPVEDLERIGRMLAHASRTICAYDGDKLVGIARSLTDFSYACYLSDLAVDEAYQKQGIGKELVNRTHDVIGPECAFLLLSAPAAMDYYPKIGFQKAENAYIIKRTQ